MVTITCLGSQLANHLNVGSSSSHPTVAITITGHLIPPISTKALTSDSAYTITLEQEILTSAPFIYFDSISTNLQSLLVGSWTPTLISQTYRPLASTTPHSIEYFEIAPDNPYLVRMIPPSNTVLPFQFSSGIYSLVITATACQTPLGNQCAITCSAIQPCLAPLTGNCNVCPMLQYQYICSGCPPPPGQVDPTVTVNYPIHLQTNNQLLASGTAHLANQELLSLTLEFTNYGDPVLNLTFDLNPLTSCPLIISPPSTEFIITNNIVTNTQTLGAGNFYLALQPASPCQFFNNRLLPYYTTVATKEESRIVGNVTLLRQATIMVDPNR